MTHKENLDEFGAWFEMGKLPDELSSVDFDVLWNLHPEEHGIIKIMGNEIPVPRWQQTYIKDYYFTGVQHKALKLPSEFKPFYKWAKKLCPDDNVRYNQALINWYKDGSHYIGAHSDDERLLVKNSNILSISLGETRIFRIRNKQTKEIIKNIPLKHGTYIIMGGTMQSRYTHEIVKVTGDKALKMKPRINITFRIFKD
jgi:alkylated DNA repair dioxygenase AlkB